MPAWAGRVVAIAKAVVIEWAMLLMFMSDSSVAVAA
jgi:hypothetical protein